MQYAHLIFHYFHHRTVVSVLLVTTVVLYGGLDARSLNFDGIDDI